MTNRLISADQLVTEIMDGSLKLANAAQHEKVFNEIRELSIRTDGLIKMPTRDEIRAFYSKRFGSRPNWLRDVIQDVTLQLDIFDFVDEAEYRFLNSSEELVAPRGFRLSDGNVTWRTITYFSEWDVFGTNLSKYGQIELPVNTFKRLIDKNGEPVLNAKGESALPTLPYGIKLLISVMYEGKEIAVGSNMELLRRRVDIVMMQLKNDRRNALATMSN